MMYSDTLMTDMTDVSLQAAFRAYYGELGVQVTNSAGLFEEIGASPDCLFVRRDGEGRVIGFLLFAMMDASSAGRGFFTTRLGCVEEFWVAAEHRRQGHGAALLRLTEEHFVEMGCAYAILTTDTAARFYERHGYRLQRGIAAKNKADVYVKPLT